MSNVTELESKIRYYNDMYRRGQSIISDSKYDELINELYLLDPNNKILNTIGYVVDDDRKRKLPMPMFSMNKVKTIKEILIWANLKNISLDEFILITPKFDGLSLCVDELKQNATTRGDGIQGQKADEHYKLITHQPSNNFYITYGEVIMLKKIFSEKYNTYSNPRNLVSGVINSKETSNILIDINYIKYGGLSNINIINKQDQIELLNSEQSYKIPYHICKISELTEELLFNLFNQYSIDYIIDGLIIEVNNLSLQEKLGRETSGNPSYARAYKHDSFLEVGISEVLGIEWNISKQGYLKPIIKINPINLDGVIISNITGNNAKYVKSMGLSTGSIVEVKRSGMVIPLITKVIKSNGFEIPKCCTSCDSLLEWNENNIELVCINDDCDGKIFKKIVSFFDILDCENIDEGTLSKLYDNGFDTIQKICKITKGDLLKLDGFGDRKSTIVSESIKSGLSKCTKSKLGHASGFFKGLGSKKLKLLEHFITKPTTKDITQIKGFSDISALSFINGYDKFNNFCNELGISFDNKIEEIKIPISDRLSGSTFVFTGVRSIELEERIISMGGKVSGSISKSTTYLIVKSLGSGSSKEQKAIENGTIILPISEFDNHFGLS